MRGCGAGAGLAVPPPLLLGLLLAAAPGTALGKETAFVEVVLFESSPSGDYTTYTTGLQGRFSRAGATLSAEGEIVQLPSGAESPQITEVKQSDLVSCCLPLLLSSGNNGKMKKT
ncbi:E3 ubiquitin-protein ligase ZNRF3 [Grus japonensis]|uniref:E3 ubiquitin-protein ligase ZNRF3 n=1 Tax=Grus japonensis TaxID=30415 RepID=A0ABC9XID5_GRUJA